MIDGIGAGFAAGNLAECHIDLGCELGDLCMSTGEAFELGVERINVVLHLLWRIAFRINRYKDNLGVNFHAFNSTAKHTHCRRADIRTVGEAKENQRPFAAKVFETNLFAMLVDEVK